MAALPYAVLPLVSRVLVAIGWVVFVAFFVTRKGPSAPEKVETRSRASLAGIVLQGVGVAALWMIQRPLPRAGAPLGAGEIAADVAAPILAYASRALGLLAVRTLGRQWSYQARLVEGHQLVTEGPYRLVRHPIYTAMFGLFVATSLAFGHWLGLVIAGPVFILGTMIRIRAEERLLRATFGDAFDAYARRVPAFIPFLRGVPRSG